MLDADFLPIVGHSGMFVRLEDGKYAFFEVNGLNNDDEPAINNEHNPQVLSSGYLKFPTISSAAAIGQPTRSGVIRRDFSNKSELLNYLKEDSTGKKGYDFIVEFDTTKEQDAIILNAAMKSGELFSNYNLLGNSCGTWARDVLTSSGTGIYNHFNIKALKYNFSAIFCYLAPNGIGLKLFFDNIGIATLYYLKTEDKK